MFFVYNFSTCLFPYKSNLRMLESMKKDFQINLMTKLIYMASALKKETTERSQSVIVLTKK